MNATEAILAAIIGGAATAAKDTMSAAVKDSYTGFKALLRKCFAGHVEAEAALKQFESDGVSGKEIVKHHLDKSDTPELTGLQDAANLLIPLLRGQGGDGGKYSVQVRGNVGSLVQGNHASVNVNIRPD